MLRSPSPWDGTVRPPVRKGGGVSDTETDNVVRVGSAPPGGLDGFFKITERGSTVRIEIMAGITTWLTMAYILFVNPAILGFAGVPDLEPLGLPFGQVLTVTALTAGVMTIAHGASSRTTRSRSPPASG